MYNLPISCWCSVFTVMFLLPSTMLHSLCVIWAGSTKVDRLSIVINHSLNYSHVRGSLIEPDAPCKTLSIGVSIRTLSPLPNSIERRQSNVWFRLNCLFNKRNLHRKLAPLLQRSIHMQQIVKIIQLFIESLAKLRSRKRQANTTITIKSMSDVKQTY